MLEECESLMMLREGFGEVVMRYNYEALTRDPDISYYITEAYSRWEEAFHTFPFPTNNTRSRVN